jgi:hypothetical protein
MQADTNTAAPTRISLAGELSNRLVREAAWIRMRHLVERTQ